MKRKNPKKVKAGKAAAKKNLRFQGRFISGKIVEVVKSVARKKRVKIQDYLNQNKEAVLALIESGFTQTAKTAEAASEIVEDLRARTVQVDTGNGIVRQSKAEAIKDIQLLKQYAASNTTIVALSIPVKIFLDNRTRITVPNPEDYEDMDGEDFENMLDDLGIWYVKSDKTGNK